MAVHYALGHKLGTATERITATQTMRTTRYSEQPLEVDRPATGTTREHVKCHFCNKEITILARSKGAAMRERIKCAVYLIAIVAVFWGVTRFPLNQYVGDGFAAIIGLVLYLALGALALHNGSKVFMSDSHVAVHTDDPNHDVLVHKTA